MRRFRARPALALGVGMEMLLAAGSGGGSGSNRTKSASSNKPVTITWWHNGNNDPLKSFWQTVATEYQTAHPNVKIEITALQNEDLRTRLTAALETNDPPNLFQQWSGGEMADRVKANLLMDISDVAKDETASVGGSAGCTRSRSTMLGGRPRCGRPERLVSGWCDRRVSLVRTLAAPLAPGRAVLDSDHDFSRRRHRYQATQPSGHRRHREHRGARHAARRRHG